MQPERAVGPAPEEIGFRPLFTRAPVVEHLLAAPSHYDAAPTYLVREFAEQSSAVKSALVRVASEAPVTAAQDTLRRQAGIAVELTAPVAFGIVRAYALARSLGMFVLGANPVMALLAGPALFLTGKRLLTDLRRAFAVDPKVRELVERASRLTEMGVYDRAAASLKEALEQDIDPDYRRNGDLYLQLGLVQMQDGRPREAMVSFARASVLFREADTTQIPRGDRNVQVSKRGLAELLAVAAIDSFASDDAGLKEWQSLLGDLGESAVRRLEYVAGRKEEGQFFGLFGRDTEAAEQGRELIAKVRFFQAKMKLRAATLGDLSEVAVLVEEGRNELEAATLEPRERFLAYLEQAHFYCAGSAKGGAVGAELARLALDLMNRAADCIVVEDPGLAARTRAEAAAFAMEVLPSLDGTKAREIVMPVLEGLDHDLRYVQARQLPYGEMAIGWVKEQRYHLERTSDARAEAVTAAAEAYLAAGEPVAAMYAALRLAYLRQGTKAGAEALETLERAARVVLEHRPDPVSIAFAGKYLLDASKATGHSPEDLDRLRSAQSFMSAAEHVRSLRAFTPFYLNGHPVVHPWHVAEVILKGQAALEFARAGQYGKAVVLFEQVRSAAGDVSEPIRLAMQLEHAVLVLESGQREEGTRLIEEVEDDARKAQNAEIQRRALEVLKRIRDEDDARKGREETQPKLEAGASPVEEHATDGGFMARFAARRQQLVQTADQVLEALEGTELAARLRSAASDPLRVLGGRLQRLKDGRFRVAIVGEFSVGKSTFLNAILGDKVLPSSVRPTTSVLTRLEWGADRLAEVCYLDGRIESRPLEELHLFVTEKANPGNERGVAAVTLRAPLELLSGGVELVDTPGLSSLIEQHDRTTWEIVPQCDALVMLASARQPYTASAGKFFDEMRGFVDGKVFYVLNKADQIEPVDLPTSSAFAAQRVGDHVQGARVFAISSYAALAARRFAAGKVNADELDEDPRLAGTRKNGDLLEHSRLPELEAALGEFLGETRGDPMLAEAARAVDDLVVMVEGLVVSEREAARLSVAEARARLRELAAAHAERTKKLDEDLCGLTRSLQSQMSVAVAEVITQFRETTPERVFKRLGLTPEVFTDPAKLGEMKEALRWHLREAANAAGAEAARRVDVARSLHVGRARMRLRELRLDAQREPALTVPSASGDTDALDTIETMGGLGETIGVFAVSGAIGFFGGALLGPIGILLGTIGGGLIDMFRKGQRFEAGQGRVRDALASATEKLAAEMEQKLLERCDDLVTAFEESVDEEGRAVLAGYEAELAALMNRAEADESTARDHDVALAALEQRTRGARQALRSFAST